MRVVIVSGGTLENTARVHRVLEQAQLRICADSGAATLLELGFRPDLVIGDMDSLDPAVRQSLEADGLHFLVFGRRKDHTDTELALDYAREQGATEIVILGALGGQRYDHALANVMLLARPDLATCPTSLLDQSRAVLIARPEQPVILEGEAGEYVSLIPLDPLVEGVTTGGLEYALQDAVMKRGPALGVSNVMLGSQASVRVKAGLLIVIHELGIRS